MQHVQRVTLVMAIMLFPVLSFLKMESVAQNNTTMSELVFGSLSSHAPTRESIEGTAYLNWKARNGGGQNSVGGGIHNGDINYRIEYMDASTNNAIGAVIQGDNNNATQTVVGSDQEAVSNTSQTGPASSIHRGSGCRSCSGRMRNRNEIQ